MKWILLLFLSVGLSACSLLQRHTDSGYYDETGAGSSSTTAQDFYSEKSQHETNLVKEELGYRPTQALSETERYNLNKRLHLKRLEARLESNREKKQYYGYKPSFNNDSERIYFLQLPTPEARERWVRRRGIVTSKKTQAPQVTKAIEESDILVGMDKDSVRESWGDPDVVEVSGNPLYGNERWKYAKMVSSSNGYNKEMRVIYFESGRVAGWERQ